MLTTSNTTNQTSPTLHTPLIYHHLTTHTIPHHSTHSIPHYPCHHYTPPTHPTTRHPHTTLRITPIPQNSHHITLPIPPQPHHTHSHTTHTAHTTPHTPPPIPPTPHHPYNTTTTTTPFNPHSLYLTLHQTTPYITTCQKCD